MFPREIVEIILRHSDGKTLRNARKVNKMWRSAVDYLATESDVWRVCCYNEIPKRERIQYFEKWCREIITKDDWYNFWDNWFRWLDITKNIEFVPELLVHIASCTCIHTNGRLLIIGYENGKVDICDKKFQLIRSFRPSNVPVDAVRLVDETEILIHTCKKVYIFDYHISNYAPGVFPDSLLFSSYKRYVCGVTPCGKITIAKLANDHINLRKTYTLITYVRIYSPATVTSCNLWEGVCTILVDNRVKIINYGEKSSQSNVVALEKAKVEFSCNDPYIRSRRVQIFNNNIVISLTTCAEEINKQILELFILGENNTHSKKMFMPWHILRANITCMYLYGNTFVIGVNNGSVYFYEIHDWKRFDISDYKHTEVVSQLSPILAVDAYESKGKRIFYVATRQKIQELVGYTILEDDDDDDDEFC